MLTIIHNNPIELTGGVLRVDRKFHAGMLNYVDHIRAPIVTVHPRLKAGDKVMDPVEVPLADLPYEVAAIEIDKRANPDAPSKAALSDLIARSQTVVGYGYGTTEMARQQGKRMIVCLEYDFQTQLVVRRSWAKSQLGKIKAVVDGYREYHGTMVPAMRHAHEVHCNGYPIYNAAEPYNSRRLLYLDSRMSTQMVISDAALESRLRDRVARPLRLMYTGRYEPMKGSLDAVKAAAECLRRGLDIEMDTYGQGSLAAEMRSVAAAAGPKIRVHDAIPFPELVHKTHQTDVFVCCHIQSDPSCTYLESMGAGLPIVGYANRMWTAMAEASNAGVVTRQNTPEAVADAIEALLKAPTGELEGHARRAQRFARAHAFEVEFARRTDAINAALEHG
jgi:glycosyltransferase involved in cell wall biosynthesis